MRAPSMVELEYFIIAVVVQLLKLLPEVNWNESSL